MLWFEENPPEQYPKLAVAAVSTHDLPTIAGIWSGADFDEQVELGLKPKAENSDKIFGYLKRATNLQEGANISDVIVKTHEALSRSPAVITLASVEDGLAAEKLECRRRIAAARLWRVATQEGFSHVLTAHL